MLTWLIALPIRLAVWLVATLGRILAALVGLALIAGGVLLSLTGILAVVGIPIAILGTAIVFKAV